MNVRYKVETTRTQTTLSLGSDGLFTWLFLYFKYFQITPSGWMLIHQRNCDVWCEYAYVSMIWVTQSYTLPLSLAASARMSSVWISMHHTITAASRTSQTDSEFSSRSESVKKNTLNMGAILCLVGTFSSFLLFKIFLLFPFPLHTHVCARI